MKIAAQRGSGDYLLIETRDGYGRVWDRLANELYPEQNIAAIAKFGYWQPYTGSEAADAIVESSRHVTDPSRRGAAPTADARRANRAALAASLALIAAFAVGCGGSPRGPAVATPPASAAGTPGNVFADIELSGRGSKVERFTIPIGAAAIATVSHRGESNIIVEAIAADGSTNKLLVNDIGQYSGTLLFDEDGSHSVAFEIDADGQWTITIRHASKARAWDGRSALNGHGDDVVRIAPAASGLTTVALAHRGESNFAIVAYGSEGRDLMVNEIGSYSGQTTLQSGAFLLEVTADGAWSVTPD